MFNCDKCGLCCRSLHLSDLYHDLDKGDGVCIHLDEKTNLCLIYHSRPEKCNIDAMYRKIYYTHMSLEEYYEMNYKVCMQLKNNALKKGEI